MSGQPVMAHPDPALLHRQVPPGQAVFTLLAGPAAWFVQLCTGYFLASWPCFPDPQRLPRPLQGYGWTGPAAVAVILIAFVIAMSATLLAWRAWARTRAEEAGGTAGLLSTGTGRTRFLALWGLLLSAGGAVATLSDLVAWLVVPRCGG